MEAKDIIAKLPDMFKAKKAKRYKRTIYLNLTGEGGGQWWLDVSREKGASEATLEIHEGPKEDARVTLECGGEDFVKLFTGQVKAMNLVNAGKIKFSGPMTEGVAFLSIWDIPKPE